VSGAAEEEKDAEFAHEDYTLVVTELQIGVKFKRAAGVKQEVDSLSKEKTSLADNISGIKEKLSDAYSKADDKDALAKEKSDEARSKDYQLDGLRGELSDEKEEVKAKSEAVAKIALELEGTKASAEEARSLSVRLEEEIKKSKGKTNEQNKLWEELEAARNEASSRADAAKVILRPAAMGTGVITGGLVRVVLEQAS
jgi:chromosome segregation ATPase